MIRIGQGLRKFFAARSPTRGVGGWGKVTGSSHHRQGIRWRGGAVNNSDLLDRAGFLPGEMAMSARLQPLLVMLIIIAVVSLVIYLAGIILLCLAEAGPSNRRETRKVTQYFSATDSPRSASGGSGNRPDQARGRWSGSRVRSLAGSISRCLTLHWAVCKSSISSLRFRASGSDPTLQGRSCRAGYDPCFSLVTRRSGR